MKQFCLQYLWGMEKTQNFSIRTNHHSKWIIEKKSNVTQTRQKKTEPELFFFFFYFCNIQSYKNKQKNKTRCGDLYDKD